MTVWILCRLAIPVAGDSGGGPLFSHSAILTGCWIRLIFLGLIFTDYYYL